MNQYLSVEQAAQYFGISKSKIYEMVSNGSIGALKIGKAIRISSKDIEAFERANHQNKKRERAF